MEAALEAALAIYKKAAPFIGLLLIPLAIALLVQQGETRHWRKQSDRFEALYHAEQTAHAVTVANYRAAADRARQLDQANAARVQSEQRLINERTSDDYETRLAAARAVADRLRGELAKAASNPGGGGATAVPGLPAAAGGAAQAAGEDGLSIDERLLATEQGIQLDELIKWIRRQAAVDPNKPGQPAGGK
jgi:hypothetical protein